MEKDTVTLIAAAIAAIASILTLLFRVMSEHRAELRETNRKALEPYIVELGSALHSVVACSYLVVHHRDDSRQQPKWRVRADQARNTLRELRPKIRYQLWGLDDGIRALIRLPDWVVRNHSNLAKVTSVLEAATALGTALDASIQKCYRFGRPPTMIERLRTTHRLSRLRLSWDDLRFDAKRRKLRLQGAVQDLHGEEPDDETMLSPNKGMERSDS